MSHEGQARFTRPMFDNLLGGEWLPAVPEVDARLRSDPPAVVADVACGERRSSIAIARAYPRVQVEGIDADPASIAAARGHLAGSGVEDRVTFHAADAADVELGRRCDLVLIVEALHDMSYPVEVRARAASCWPRAGASWWRTSGSATCTRRRPTTSNASTTASASCTALAVGLVGEGAAGTGSVLRPRTLRRYAEAAGLHRFDVLPIENDFYRFYRLRP